VPEGSDPPAGGGRGGVGAVFLEDVVELAESSELVEVESSEEDSNNVLPPEPPRKSSMTIVTATVKGALGGLVGGTRAVVDELADPAVCVEDAFWLNTLAVVVEGRTGLTMGAPTSGKASSELLSEKPLTVTTVAAGPLTGPSRVGRTESLIT
jgi:hypothetical protein